MSVSLSTNAVEESTYCVTVNFFNEDSDPVIPNAATWTLTDLEGNVINSRVDEVITPAASVNILLSGDDLAVSGDNTGRLILIEADYDSSKGTGLPLNEELQFTITKLVNIP